MTDLRRVPQPPVRLSSAHVSATSAMASRVRASDEDSQPCPRCGHTMPALKGGTASICPNCGFKDACCY